MRTITILLLVFLYTSCEEEKTLSPDLSHVNTRMFVEGNIEAGSQFRAIYIEPGEEGSIPNIKAYEPEQNGFSRNGNSSLVAYLGKLFIGSGQRNQPCYEIEPLVWGAVNHLADQTAVALTPTFFLEFPGVPAQGPDCKIDSAAVASHLRLGNFLLGQQPGRAHIHLYAHGLFTGAENILATDFYLSPDTENQNLSLTITELDFESAKYTDARGVFVSFEMPLAKGFNSYSGTLYKITDLRGRLFFPFD